MIIEPADSLRQVRDQILSESGGAMVHISCDVCGTDLGGGANGRYIVKMEVYAAFDQTELTEDDLDSDHLEKISQIIAEEGPEAEPAPAAKKLRYDLCRNCHRKFLTDPLGREVLKLHFSEN